MGTELVLDPVQRRVVSIVLAEVRRAYGAAVQPPEPVCRECLGDGCRVCGWTGDPPK